jgi:cytochrome P450
MGRRLEPVHPQDPEDPVPTTIDLTRFNPFDPSIQQDPHPWYHAMRSASPAFAVPGMPLYVVTRFDLVKELARNTRVFSNAFGGPGESPRPDLVAKLREIQAQGWPQIGTMLTIDPPEHDQYRATIQPRFNARLIGALRPQITEIVDRVIDGFVADGRVDLQRRFSTPIPVEAIAMALQLPRDRGADIKRWSDASVAAIGTALSDDRRLESQREVVEMQHFMHDQLMTQRAEAREGIVRAIAEGTVPADDGERGLTDAEMISIFQQLLVAGNETTTKLFNEMVKLLAENKEWWWRLKADASLAVPIVEEALRLATPTQGMFRLVTEDTEIDGVPVPAGARLILMYSAANRDPAVFPDPDSFDPGRPNVRDHLAFGVGTHFCIGAPLSRLEAVVAIERLAERWDDFTLAADNRFEYEPSFVLRGLKELFVEFSPAPLGR